MRKIKIRGQLLAHPSAINVVADGEIIYRGFVGVNYPLFTEIDLCICEIDCNPAEDKNVNLEIKVDVGVVKIGNIRPNLGNIKKINSRAFDKMIDTVDGKFWGTSSDFRQEIFIDNQSHDAKPGWHYEVNIHQTFKTKLFIPKELQYDEKYVRGDTNEKIDSFWR